MKLNKKAVFLARTAAVLFTVLLLQAVTLAASAQGNIDEYYSQQLEASGADELLDILPAETRDYLKSIGCDEVDFYKIFDSSPREIITVLLDIVRGGLKTPLRALCTVVGTLLLMSVVQSFFFDDSHGRGVASVISGCVLIIGVFSPLYTALRGGVSCVSLTAGFERGLIPAFAAAVTASGNPSLALSYSTFALAAAQGVEALADKAILPLSAAALALGVSGAAAPALRLGTLGETLSKSVRTLLGIAAGLFSSVLTVRALVARSADGLISKGIKLAVSSFVPVVGGALSEAYSTVAGSLSLLGSAVGAFGIAAVFVLNIPVIAELLLWSAALRIGELAAQLLGQEGAAGIIKAIGAAVSVVNILVIYCVAVFIISCGIVLALRTEA